VSEVAELYIGLGGGGAPDGPRQSLVLKRANRHGLIAGATGTGKTVTLQGLAESFSAVGVPVFVADVKGDLSGLAMAGSPMQAARNFCQARRRHRPERLGLCRQSRNLLGPVRTAGPPHPHHYL
jgi:uncharacterized protein